MTSLHKDCAVISMKLDFWGTEGSYYLLYCAGDFSINLSLFHERISDMGS